MFTFALLIVVLTGLALVFLLPPLLKKRTEKVTVEQEELTVNVYQDQLDELENDLKNTVISQDQYDAAKMDIERNLLSDMDQAKAKAEHVAIDQRQPKVAIVIAIVLPLMAVGLYAMLGAGKSGLDPSAVPPQVDSEQHDNQSIENMIVQLQERLQQQPNDGEGWLMLAKTYQFSKRYDDAVDAYKNVLALGGGQVPDIRASFADALAMANGRRLVPEAIEQLEKALEIDPKHVKSLWLMGTAAYQEQDFQHAMEFWQRLYDALPADSKDREQIASNINEVRGMLGKEPMVVSPSQPAAQTSTASQKANVSIHGMVSLGGAVANKASPEDTVFVFARAAQGPRMPLAIVRKQVKDLPFEFKLDDSMAMNPDMKLSSFPKVVVGARVSKSGNAMPQPGDLEGFSGEVGTVGSNEVNLTINRLR